MSNLVDGQLPTQQTHVQQSQQPPPQQIQQVQQLDVNALAALLKSALGMQSKRDDGFDDSCSLDKLAEAMVVRGKSNESNFENLGEVKEVKKDEKETKKTIDRLSHLD